MVVDFRIFIIQGLCSATVWFVGPMSYLVAKIISLWLGISSCAETGLPAPLVIPQPFTLKRRAKPSPCVCRQPSATGLPWLGLMWSQDGSAGSAVLEKKNSLETSDAFGWCWECSMELELRYPLRQGVLLVAFQGEDPQCVMRGVKGSSGEVYRVVFASQWDGKCRPWLYSWSRLKIKSVDLCLFCFGVMPYWRGCYCNKIYNKFFFLLIFFPDRACKCLERLFLIIIFK